MRKFNQFVRVEGLRLENVIESTFEVIRQALTFTDGQDLQPIKDDGIACPKCKEGDTITILVLNGYGNIVSGNVLDEISQLELEAIGRMIALIPFPSGLLQSAARRRAIELNIRS